jgi:hypothetical protein
LALSQFGLLRELREARHPGGSPLLKALSVINIPDSDGTLFDHGAFEARSRRVFVAHTAKDRIEVIDHDARLAAISLRFPAFQNLRVPLPTKAMSS